MLLQLLLLLCAPRLPGYCWLSSALLVQAERWGAQLLTEDVEFVDFSRRPFTIRTSETEVRC